MSVAQIQIMREMVREQTQLAEGAAVLVLPDTLSAESVEDFEYWVKGILRKMRRKAGLLSDD